MRWQGQRIDETDAEALPGMENRTGFLRTVTTPEFAGMTFHEVLAKSALNHVPGPSKMPFSWTINPYRGCSHACVYCVSPDTMILCADGRQRPLRDLEVGDEIYGTEKRGAYRRYVCTRIQAKWSTRKPAYRIALADGTSLVASGDHRFLTDRGWRHVTGGNEGQRPHLTTNNRLMGLGAGAISAMELNLEGTAVKTVADLRVRSIDALDGERELLDITTGTGDFIANGVISHNCFARGTHTYLDLDAGRDFDSQIVVKVNVVETLEKELRRGSWKHETVALGTNTDPYQRAEGRYRLMPGIVGALAESGTPFSVLTKGTLIRRDIPLLVEAANRVPVDVQLSIAMFDETLREAIEPGAPSTQARLDTVRALSDAGFRVGVFLMPILPHLTDSVGAIDSALRRIKEAGADHVVYGALHLRAGVKPWFLQWLSQHRPDLLSSYRELYPGSAVEAPTDYRKWLGRRVKPLIRMHGLEARQADDSPPRRRSFSEPEPANPQPLWLFQQPAQETPSPSRIGSPRAPAPAPTLF
ncbi:Rv2578c family radical SAM protein [Microbacterium sp. 22242]|uniref:Rv2578c family radical SAM protein n=1 Tax=Microbacterium sp. 22242 TaxID=3453896 RepID=UPI003F875924